MARIHHARPQQQQGATRAMTIGKSRAALKKKKPYKIVLEAVTQEKKKLHSILTYAANAPKGFGFVPAGHPEITEWCKEQCRQRNLDVHVVSAKPKNKTHADPEKLSHHVHRIGHHFPLEIIELACSKFGYEYNDEGGLRKTTAADRENWIQQQVESYSTRQALHGRATAKEGSKDHISGAVREMFPKIPEEDLASIVNHAFEEGTNRVGNAKELPLARRVQLAVVAHIRHTYTDYDKMLKTGSWMEARQKVEHVSLAKLKEWRDETGEQSNEIEDTSREVIVLDDEDEISEGGDTPDEREQSMEIVSNRIVAQDIELERYPQYAIARDHERRQGHGRTIFVHPYPPPPTAHTAQAPQYQAPVSRTSLAYEGSGRSEAAYTSHNRPTDQQPRPTVTQPKSRPAPAYMRGADGRLFELIPVDDTPSRVEYEQPHRSALPRHIQEGHAPPSSRVDTHSSRIPPPPTRRTSDHETVLPSVERETFNLVPPPQTVHNHRPDSDRYDMLRENENAQLFNRRAPLPAPQPMDGPYEQRTKRRTPPLHEQDMHPRQIPRQSAMHSHRQGDYLPMETRSRHRAHPSQEIIDLTSSPRRPPFGNAGVLHFAPQSCPAYVPEKQYRTSVRNEYHGQVAGARSHAYIPEHDRMYQRRPPPPHEYIPLRR